MTDSTSNQDIQSILENANAAWNQALNTGNVKALAALYKENATLSPGNGATLTGHNEIENLFKGFVDGGVHNHTLEIVSSGGSEKVIYQVARWSANGAPLNGATPSFGGITTNVLEKDANEKWLTSSHVWNMSQ